MPVSQHLATLGLHYQIIIVILVTIHFLLPRAEVLPLLSDIHPGVLDPVEVRWHTVYHEVVQVHVGWDGSLVDERVHLQLHFVLLVDLPSESLLESDDILDPADIFHQLDGCLTSLHYVLREIQLQ